MKPPEAFPDVRPGFHLAGFHVAYLVFDPHPGSVKLKSRATHPFCSLLPFWDEPIWSYSLHRLVSHGREACVTWKL